MRIGIVTHAQDGGTSEVGSTRIRVAWPLRYWPEAEQFQPRVSYDVIVFQKAYWRLYARRFSGLKIVDLCDPDFLRVRSVCLDMMEACDGITCASQALTDHVASLTGTPVWTVPDRIDFDAVGARRKAHQGPTRTVAWYGYSENFPMLDTLIDGILALRIPQLLVIANRQTPYVLPAAAHGRIALTNRPWSAHTVHDDLLQADVVINPRSACEPWRFKSNNKTILAWALGLPVAHTAEELARLMTGDERQREADRRYAEVRATYDVRQTVEDYRRIIGHLLAERAAPRTRAAEPSGV